MGHDQPVDFMKDGLGRPNVRWILKRSFLSPNLFGIFFWVLMKKGLYIDFYKHIGRLNGQTPPPSKKADKFAMKLALLCVNAAVCWAVCRDDKQVGPNTVILSDVDRPLHSLAHKRPLTGFQSKGTASACHSRLFLHRVGPQLELLCLLKYAGNIPTEHWTQLLELQSSNLELVFHWRSRRQSKLSPLSEIHTPWSQAASECARWRNRNS